LETSATIYCECSESLGPPSTGGLARLSSQDSMGYSPVFQSCSHAPMCPNTVQPRQRRRRRSSGALCLDPSRVPVAAPLVAAPVLLVYQPLAYTYDHFSLDALRTANKTMMRLPIPGVCAGLMAATVQHSQWLKMQVTSSSCLCLKTHACSGWAERWVA
jgi:hypothetical protein